MDLHLQIIIHVISLGGPLMGYSPSRDGYWYMVGIVRYLSFKKNILFFYQIYSYQISLGNKRCGEQEKPGILI
jgi:hypothetical protein